MLPIFLQTLLPQHLMSALARRLAYSTNPWLKQCLIDFVIRKYQVDLHDAQITNPRSYPSFNAFFTRALTPEARQPDRQSTSLLMPADGCISQCGRLQEGCLLQAKGKTYPAATLLGNKDDAQAFADGSFITIYLSPRDYHRVHMPWQGALQKTVHIPGRLLSVSPANVNAISGLFARNERLICHFQTNFGPMAIVMVGAIFVSGIETVWNGIEIPSYAQSVRVRSWRHTRIDLPRLTEMARFNFGSTVIVLLPSRRVRLCPELSAGQQVRLGQRLGILAESGPPRTE